MAQDAQDPASRWREYAGRDDWTNLLEQFDPVLRSELLRYGGFSQACYDAFDFNKYSKYCGGCRYDRPSFFESQGLAGAGYNVMRYLYATSNIKLPNFSLTSMSPHARNNGTNWIGFVAVSDDDMTRRLGRRDVVVSWRGSVTELDWLSDLKATQLSVSSEGIPCPPTVKAQAGFLNLYTDKNSSSKFTKYSARDQVLTEIKRQVKIHAEERGEEVSISLTGHSLGSALAMINAIDVAELGLHRVNEKVVPVTVYSFAGPRVGNESFKRRFDELGVKCIRVVNVQDVVPNLPGSQVNEGSPKWLRDVVAAISYSYVHVGVRLTVDNRRSPFLKETVDLVGFHNLETYLHLIDGCREEGRDKALVNKMSGFLKEDWDVPPYWRQEANKGLVRNADGRWRQPERIRFEGYPDDIDELLREIGLRGENNAQ